MCGGPIKGFYRYPLRFDDSKEERKLGVIFQPATGCVKENVGPGHAIIFSTLISLQKIKL